MYGVLIVLGILIALCAGYFRKRHNDVSGEDFLLCAAIAVAFGFVGAKLFSLVGNLPKVVRGQYSFTDVLKNGFIFYGGFFGGAAGIIFYCRRYKLSLLQVADSICVVVPLAHAFGRVGCFCAGCCYGCPTDSTIGIAYDEPLAYNPYIGQKLVPVQLIEAAALLALFAFLMIFGAKKRRKGFLAYTYVTAYAVIRFVTEFWRGDKSRGFVGMLSTSQFIAVIILLVSAAIAATALVRRRRIKQMLSKLTKDNG